MYQTAARLDPQGMEVIACQLYLELLKQGYTSVCEFHYLHLDPQGQPYADASAMSQSLLAAASAVGMGITLLPVLYQRAGFADQDLSPEQKRFGMSTQGYIDLANQLARLTQGKATQTVGLAVHSLRAVEPRQMTRLLSGREAAQVFHLHVAEQAAEVSQCERVLGQRPVRYLLDHFDLDSGWCLVHATHLDPGEIAELTASQAVVGLCPTTEANLGDGIFPLKPFLEHGGRFGIGSDSQVSVSPVEELRWLEYGQRLTTQQRNLVASPNSPHCGETLWRQALLGGAQASGRAIGRLAVGYRADWLCLDEDTVHFAGLGQRQWLDALVFAGNECLVRDVFVAGQAAISDGHHAKEADISGRYKALLDRWSD